MDHQRLSGLGYCFSASLPPYLATGAICALQRMQEQPELVLRVAQNAQRMRELLQHIPGLSVSSYMVDVVWQIFARHVHFVRCMHTW